MTPFTKEEIASVLEDLLQAAREARKLGDEAEEKRSLEAAQEARELLTQRTGRTGMVRRSVRQE